MDAQALNVPVTFVFSLAAAAALTVCAAKARLQLDRRLCLMAAAVMVLVLAAQFVSRSVAPGVSVHLVGGALAAMLVGPWAGTFTLALVAVLHSVLGDAGLSALGPNVVNLAILGTLGAYLVVVLLLKVLPKNPDGLAATALIASIAGVVAATSGYLIEYALGATASQPVAMIVEAQLMIGIGEGLITATVVVVVARFRPGLVYVLGGYPRRVRHRAPGPNFRRRSHIVAPPSWDPTQQGGLFRIARRRTDGAAAQSPRHHR
ncbi:energy-coupling factor ABC transporter permease [Actinoplanes sp. NPDC051861]|uniref:energy-coupling factor ABC transporter permease n=1 Tax=Actinoplanes sp. NPDC051861 TaxID=3155170 RepID=UPI00343E6ED9